MRERSERRPSAQAVNAFMRGEAPMPVNMQPIDLPDRVQGYASDIILAILR